MSDDIKKDSNSNVQPKAKILKVPLGEIGKWFHKKWNTINFTPEYFEKAITNFKNNVLKHNPYLTYGHLKEPYSVDSERRRGELLDLQFEGRHLFGIFAATEEAYNYVKNGEYLYASAEIIPDFIDKDTGMNVGPVILRAALTNSPFLPASEVVALSTELGLNSEDICVLSIHQANNLTTELVEGTEVVPEEVSSQGSEEEITHKDEETIVESTVSTSEKDSDKETNEVQDDNSINQEPDNQTDKQAIEVEEQMTTPVIEENKVETPNKPAEVQGESNNQSTQSVTNNTPIVPKALTQNVHALTESIKSKVATKYEAQLASYAQTVEALKAELNAVQERLSGNEQKAKAYELSISQASAEIERANRQILVDHMLGQGVPPVLANKFTEVSEAYLNNQSTIKLSLEGSEPVERTLLDAVAELIISAANTPPISLSQSGSPYSKPYDPTGRTQYISKIIEKNYEMARNV